MSNNRFLTAAWILISLFALEWYTFCFAEGHNGGVWTPPDPIATDYFDIYVINPSQLVINAVGSGTNFLSNQLGTCSNCSYITTQELHFIGAQILNKCQSIEGMCQQIIMQCRYGRDEVAKWFPNTFQAGIWVGETPGSTYSSNIVAQTYQTVIGYIDGLQNTDQKNLALKYLDDYYYSLSGSHGALYRKQISVLYEFGNYMQGLYDMVDMQQPSFASIDAEFAAIKSESEEIENLAWAIEGTVTPLLTVEACPCPGQNSNNGGDYSHCAWTTEQIVHLLNLTEDIDAEQVRRKSQLDTMNFIITNFWKDFTGYAKFMGDVFYNADGTIRLGSNTWEQIYHHQVTPEYTYNHSNILQRIELILYGLANMSVSSSNALEGVQDDQQSELQTTFNSLDFSSVEENIRSKISENTDLYTRLKTLGQHIIFISNAGDLQSFTVGKVRDFDNQEIYMTSSPQWVESLRPFQSFLRQLSRFVYALLALSWVWFFYAKLYKYIIIGFKAVFDFVNQLFAS